VFKYVSTSPSVCNLCVLWRKASCFGISQTKYLSMVRFIGWVHMSSQDRNRAGHWCHSGRTDFGKKWKIFWRAATGNYHFTNKDILLFKTMQNFLEHCIKIFTKYDKRGKSFPWNVSKLTKLKGLLLKLRLVSILVF
jgi:hypothetical protein